MKYKSNRNFKLWFYSISHNSLLLRSQKQYIDVDYSVKYEPNHTIDIEFSGVEYMDIPTILDDITIEIVDKIPKKFQKYINSKIFLISSDNKQFHIVASTCIVGLSFWELKENRLNNMELNYDEIVFKI